MATYDEDKLPPWPLLADGWDEASIVPRRTAPLSIGMIVFVHTDTRVYSRRPGETMATSGPIARYHFEARKIVDETRVSWLLASHAWQTGHFDKAPKRDLSAVFGRDDVEDALWIGSHQHKIAGAVGALRERGQETRAQLEAIAQILGMEINGGKR